MTIEEKLKKCMDLLNEIDGYHWGCGCCGDYEENRELEAKIRSLLALLREAS